jgi:putative ABC transport system permease protein
MFSNFSETTNIRLNAIVPSDEMAAAPLLMGRLIESDGAGDLVAPGKVLIPELLAKGMKVGLGDEVVLVATNQDGSVNGRGFIVGGILGSVTGPGGRDGYIHIDDARQLLRIADAQISEVVVRLKDPGRVEQVGATLKAALAEATNKEGKPVMEVHPWMQLTPFYNIARMIDLLTLFIQIMLVSIVLISVMNVMMMAVYERIREIGAIAAIGTRPGTILVLFVTEGFLMGVLGSFVGTFISLLVIGVLNNVKLSFEFGREMLVLEPTIDAATVIVACVTVIAMAVLASLQPAWKAARMDPIDALRHV